MKSSKDWKVDLPPIVFFGLVVATKTYFLWQYLKTTEDLWQLLTHLPDADHLTPDSAYFLTSHFSYIAYYATATAFDALVFYSFLVRGSPKTKPVGFWENGFPLLTVFVPVIGFTLMFVPAIRQVLPHYPISFLQALAEITPRFPFYLNIIGLAVGFCGAAFSIWAISHLRRSFGLRTAVRELVTSGPYQRIRHPLYLGEIVHVFGIAILAATPAAILLFVVAVGMQLMRAKIEERKFLKALPGYAAYQRTTGFLLPKWQRQLD